MSVLDRVSAAILLLFGSAKMLFLAGRQPPLFGFLTFLAALALLYLLFRTAAWLRKQVLWSLRNRLIVAYIFIAVVPVVLLLTMAAMALYYGYLQLGAHLLHDDLQERIEQVGSTADVLAGALANESAEGIRASGNALLAQPTIKALLQSVHPDLPDIQAELNTGNELLNKSAGAENNRFEGIVQTGDSLWLRAVVRRQGLSGAILVSVSVPLSPELLDSLSSEVGPIQLTPMRTATQGDAGGLTLDFDGRRFIPSGQIKSRRRTLAPKKDWFDLQVNGLSTIEAVSPDPSARTAMKVPVLASFAMRPSQLNRRLFTSLGALGELLVPVLFAVGVVFLVLEVAALVVGIVLTRTITHAVADLYDATQHVRKGDLRHRVRLQRRDQLGVLAESFNAMTGAVAELIEEQRQRQRLENELSIAREVQAQLFPQTLPSLEGIQLAAICRAARVVSGDYYDCIRLSPTRVGIAVADISGKGISAALLMASLQAALRSQVLLDGNASVAELVGRLNRHLFVNTLDDRYATFFYAVYDTATRILTYTNAGHPPPFYIVGDRATPLDEGGTVVGLFSDCAYTQSTIRVAPGSLLVAYSDGLIEPENVYGEEFGTRRLTEEVIRRKDAPPQRLAEDLLRAAEQWASSPEQADDMTVVVARLG
jgi:phosphoserine phosphatase RsbU/P